VIAADQQRPSLVQLPDGVLLAAWTDGSREGTDLSETAVRVVAFTPRELFPIE